MKYQFTLFSKKYRPIATVVEANNRQEFVNGEEPYKKAMQNILLKKNWTMADLKTYGYDTWKVRKAEEVA